MAAAITSPAFAMVAGGATIFNAANVAWVASEIWIFSRDRARVAGRLEDRGSRRVVVLAIIAAITLALAAASVPGTAIDLPPAALTFAGVVLMLAGIVFRLTAVRTLGRFFRTSVTMQDDHRLIADGPYRWLRNPSYSGSMTTLTGFGLAIGNYLALAFAILLPLAGYWWRIRIEEASLAGRFGPRYDEYRAVRWALVPFVW